MPGGFVDLGRVRGDTPPCARSRRNWTFEIEITGLVGVYSRAEDRTVVVVYAAARAGHPVLDGGGAGGSGVRADRYPMAGPGLLERRTRVARPPQRAASAAPARRPDRPPARSRSLLVLAATLAGGYLALVGYHDERPAVGRRDPDVGLDPGTAARSTSTCRWWTGARASRRSARRCGSASTCRPSTATVAQSLAEGKSLDVEQVARRGARRARRLPDEADRADGRRRRSRSACWSRSRSARARPAAALDERCSRSLTSARRSASRWSC